MSYTRSDGTTTPNLAGLIQLASGFRINDGTFVLTRCDLFDSAPVRPSVSTLPNDHGGYPTTPYYDPWPFVIEGYLTVNALADVWAAKDDLKRVFNLNAGLQTLILNTSGWSATRQIDARVNGPIIFTEPLMLAKNVPDRDFVIPMIAPDPRIYATSQTSTTVTSGTTVTNNGTAPTPITVRFTSNSTWVNPQIDGPGTAGTNRIKYTGTITSGHWVEITANAATATGVTAVDDTGANVYANVSAFTARTLAPGGSSWTATQTSGTGTTAVKFRDAWA